MLASHDEDAIADDELLTGTGSGGVFASGYLHDRPLIEYLAEDERVDYLLANKRKGVREASEHETITHTPGDGYRAIAAITDTRLLFVVGASEGDESFSVPYTSIENTKTGRGVLSKYVDVWTTEGVRWRFYVKNGVDIDPVAEYVERAAVVWSRVESQLRQARRRYVDIDEAVDGGDHQAARAAVAEAREFVEEAKRKAGDLTTDRDDAIWDHVDTAQRRLEENVLKVHHERGRQLAREAERQWRNEQYNQAYDSYLTARNQFERALDVAREHDLPETADLRDRIDDLTDTLDHLSKSPLRRAEEAHERATDVDDPELAADLLEDALEKHQTAMVLDWGNEQSRFAGDSERLREQVSQIITEIDVVRRTLARRHRERAETRFEDGQYGQAKAAYETAREHLASALAIAEELKPDLVDDLESDIAELDAAVDQASTRVEESGFEFVGDAEN